jgi:hypothetical protein
MPSKSHSDTLFFRAPTTQSITEQALAWCLPDNLGTVSRIVDRYASNSLGLAIVTFDFYTADLTDWIVLANKNRVGLLRKMRLIL